MGHILRMVTNGKRHPKTALTWGPEAKRRHGDQEWPEAEPQRKRELWVLNCVVKQHYLQVTRWHSIGEFLAHFPPLTIQTKLRQSYIIRVKNMQRSDLHYQQLISLPRWTLVEALTLWLNSEEVWVHKERCQQRVPEKKVNYSYIINLRSKHSYSIHSIWKINFQN